MNQLLRLICIAIPVVLLLSCTSTPNDSQQQAIQEYAQVADLESHLAAAEQDGIDYLAPTAFNAAKKKLAAAIASASAQQDAEVDQLVRDGLRHLQAAESNADASRTIMQEVIEIRQRAISVGAPNLYQEQFKDLENDLKRATREVERGNFDNASKWISPLSNGYSSLELASLQNDTTQMARDDIAYARQQSAHKYAPKTLKHAEQELELAINVLETDRTHTDKAREHALRASWWAKRSVEIVNLIHEFDQGDYSQEDVVLWYQKQLSTINQPSGDELPFDRSNHAVVERLQDKIARLIRTESRVVVLQEAELETRKDLEEIERGNRQAQARYDQIQTLFNEAEANVYRQGANVLLVTHAFYFSVGGSDIQPENYDLLAKIISAIRLFPAPQVVVRGHTDTTGSAQKNLQLSQLRAENVAAYLQNLGVIPTNSIMATGYGEARPVASNETAAGRALNRRIEVLIINK